MQNRHIIFGAILVALAFLAGAQAVSPAPDGCYPNFTTAEGCNALKFLTTGAANTGVGGSRSIRVARRLQHRSWRRSAGSQHRG